jgi:hypothetical protein
MEVRSTEHFNDRFRRYTGKKLVRGRLKHILKTIDAVPNAWLPQFDHIRKCAIKQTFSDEIGKGDRLIVTHQPPIVLLDLGEHDPTYRRWTVGETPESIQVARLERNAALPMALEEVVEAWATLGH